ncbi:MAG: hypothetical protein GKR95_02120 [Gammaproteobacteria bacterium]|nr:hypothetical protein [Gammaproteobacteria bacterium]
MFSSDIHLFHDNPGKKIQFYISIYKKVDLAGLIALCFGVVIFIGSIVSHYMFPLILKYELLEKSGCVAVMCFLFSEFRINNRFLAYFLDIFRDEKEIDKAFSGSVSKVNSERFSYLDKLAVSHILLATYILAAPDQKTAIKKELTSQMDVLEDSRLALEELRKTEPQVFADEIKPYAENLVTIGLEREALRFFHVFNLGFILSATFLWGFGSYLYCDSPFREVLCK